MCLIDQSPWFCYLSNICSGMWGCQASCQDSNCWNICCYGSFRVEKVSGSVYPKLVHFTPLTFLVCLTLPLNWGKVRPLFKKTSYFHCPSSWIHSNNFHCKKTSWINGKCVNLTDISFQLAWRGTNVKNVSLYPTLPYKVAENRNTQLST